MTEREFSARNHILSPLQRIRLPLKWIKDYFQALSEAKPGVYPAPFCHQVSALEEAYDGNDLFVSTGTGSGKTECFMWPLMAKFASEARNQPESWQMRGVRTIVMYPMNALVSDQISRLRRSAGEVSLLIRRLFHRLGIDRNRVQFILTTASMSNNDEADKKAVHLFANTLTASDDIRPFIYLRGKREKIETTNTTDIPLAKFLQAMPEQFKGETLHD